MKKSLLIAGTDTDVGKTVLTTALVAYWQTYRISQSLGLMKLMQTGVGDDERYRQLFSEVSSLKIVTPLFFDAPLAPPLAARKTGQEVDLKIVWQALSQLQQQQDFVLIEALGGLGSPVTYELTVANIAADWDLPTILVVPVKLGSIAQAVANVTLARSLKVELKGIILNCSRADVYENITDLAPVDLIQSLTQIPVLGIIPYIDDLSNKQKLAQIAANLDLERMIDY